MLMNSKRKKVLIVDDEFTSRRLIGQIIRTRFKCDVIEAQDGSEALQMMIRDKPDLVFLDMMMPFMNGVQVLQTMKKNAKLSHIPVVACTSVDDDAVVKKIIQFGVDQYLVKPVTHEAVVEKVSRFL